MAVRLTVPRDEAALVSRSRFLRPLDGSKTRVFAVAWPGVLELLQRRAHVRYGFDWPIHFRRLDPVTREPRGKAASGATINISAGGLLFESDTPPGVDEELALTLPLLGGDPVKMDGVVVRVRAADAEGSGPDGGHPRTEVAVKFTRITALDQKRLVRFVLRPSTAGARPYSSLCTFGRLTRRQPQDWRFRETTSRPAVSRTEVWKVAQPPGVELGVLLLVPGAQVLGPAYDLDSYGFVTSKFLTTNGIPAFLLGSASCLSGYAGHGRVSKLSGCWPSAVVLRYFFPRRVAT